MHQTLKEPAIKLPKGTAISADIFTFSACLCSSFVHDGASPSVLNLLMLAFLAGLGGEPTASGGGQWASSGLLLNSILCLFVYSISTPYRRKMKLQRVP